MEEWKDIPGYEGLYQASNYGRIRTKEGKTTKNALAVRVWKQRILKPKYAFRKDREKRDARIKLWKDGKEKMFLVARIVAITWCGGYEKGMTVNHIDGNPLNNRADNLEWLSLADNIRHGFATGLYKTGHECVLRRDGEEIKLISISAAARFLNRSNTYVVKHAKTDGEVLALNGNKYQMIL